MLYNFCALNKRNELLKMTDNTKKNFLSSQIKDDEIDLGKIFRFLMMQSKLIISIVFVAFTLSHFYTIFLQQKIIQ